MSPEDIQKDFGDFVGSDEKCLAGFKHGRDFVILTDRRLINVDVKGMSGKKKRITSYPYSKILSYTVTTAGSIDTDTEVEFQVSGSQPIKFDIKKNYDIAEIVKIMADYIK